MWFLWCLKSKWWYHFWCSKGNHVSGLKSRDHKLWCPQSNVLKIQCLHKLKSALNLINGCFKFMQTWTHFYQKYYIPSYGHSSMIVYSVIIKQCFSSNPFMCNDCKFVPVILFCIMICQFKKKYTLHYCNIVTWHCSHSQS